MNNYPTDEELMRAVEQRDRNAFEEFYDRHARLVFSFVYKTLGDKQRTEEVVQDLFYKVWNSNVHYDPSKSSLRTWLLVIARRIAIDYLRKANPARTAGPIDDLQAILPASAEEAPERQAELSEVKALVASAMGELPEDQKWLVEHMYFHGLTQQELAEQLGIPLGTVKSRLRLAMTKLRRSLVVDRLEELL